MVAFFGVSIRMDKWSMDFAVLFLWFQQWFIQSFQVNGRQRAFVMPCHPCQWCDWALHILHTRTIPHANRWWNERKRSKSIWVECLECARTHMDKWSATEAMHVIAYAKYVLAITNSDRFFLAGWSGFSVWWCWRCSVSIGKYPNDNECTCLYV